jgi:hypothetical protein
MQRIVGTMAVVIGAVWIGAASAIPTDGGGRATAAERDAIALHAEQAESEAALQRDMEALYVAVRAYRDVEMAAEAGYAQASGCMTSDVGAQGIHLASDALFVPAVDAHAPQLLMYEPQADGSMRFIGIEYLVFQEAWHAAGHEERPVLFGQTFGLNETLLDEPFYLLHVWIAQYNPLGLFADWNPLVDCSHEGAVESTHGVGGH